MSLTLAAVADALIEFILSLLTDPEAADEFESDPEAALQHRGLANVTAADVCAVAPVIAERANIVPVVRASSNSGDDTPSNTPSPAPTPPSPSPAVREIQNITHNYAVDDRDTIIDQSVNQNIWAAGDVTQTFDQEAVAATGTDSIAAGDDVDIDQTEDNSTAITAGDDANIGNNTTETTVDDSFNEATDSSTTTETETDATAEESFNDESSTETATDSHNDSATTYTETAVDVDASTVYDSTESAIVDETTADEQL